MKIVRILEILGIILIVAGGFYYFMEKSKGKSGTGFGTRVFRIRLDSNSATPEDATEILDALPEMDNANRFSNGVPGAKDCLSASDMLAGIQAINQPKYFRTFGKSYCISHRLSWTDYNTGTGSPVDNFVENMKIVWEDVYSKTSPLQTSLSVDNAASLPAETCFDIVKQGKAETGFTNFAIGAEADLNAVGNCNFAMLCTDPSSLSVSDEVISELKSYNYLSISSHIDESKDFDSWLVNFPTLNMQEDAFNEIFQKQPVPATAQLMQGTLYNAITGKAVSASTGKTYPYPTLDYWANLIKENCP